MVSDSGHMIPVERPDVIVNAVREIRAAARLQWEIHILSSEATKLYPLLSSISVARRGDERTRLSRLRITQGAVIRSLWGEHRVVARIGYQTR